MMGGIHGINPWKNNFGQIFVLTVQNTIDREVSTEAQAVKKFQASDL